MRMAAFGRLWPTVCADPQRDRFIPDHSSIAHRTSKQASLRTPAHSRGRRFGVGFVAGAKRAGARVVRQPLSTHVICAANPRRPGATTTSFEHLGTWSELAMNLTLSIAPLASLIAGIVILAAHGY